jgi:hypothetical protein
VRCSTNGSECVYGVSRKHGKPGRTRKRNPDGTPFIKASKQRPSPNGSEFSKFRVRAEPLLPDVSDLETSSWPSTPSWPATPDFEFEMTPEPMFPEPDFNFMDDLIMASPASHEDTMQAIESEQLTFRDPFAKTKSMQHELSLPSEFQALKDFVGGDLVNPTDYSFDETNVESFFSDWSESPQNSPRYSDSFFANVRGSVAVPAPHSCYNLAYSTLESLQCRTSQGTQGPMPSNIELKSLDSVLSTTKSAVQNVVQLLACPCSSDPHLAMLYSSIASKILAWYQIAAGLKDVSTHPPALDACSTPSLSSSTWSSPALSSSSAFSDFSSPLPTPSPTNTTFNIKPQPLKIGLFEFDAEDQENLRRQVVLKELKKSGAMIDALANWSSEGESEQAEFLYDVLGAWLKSELYKTLREVEGEEAEMC